MKQFYLLLAIAIAYSDCGQVFGFDTAPYESEEDVIVRVEPYNAAYD